MNTTANRNYFHINTKPQCGFCRRNKESESVYSSHQLRDEQGRVTCPQLFKYRCELCGATGEEAHTRSYCPTVAAFRQQPSPTERRRRTDSASSSSTYKHYDNKSEEQAATINGRSIINQQQQEQSFSIHLGSDRMFRNMRGVTSTRYNSAGKLRKPIYGQCGTVNPRATRPAFPQ